MKLFSKSPEKNKNPDDSLSNKRPSVKKAASSSSKSSKLGDENKASSRTNSRASKSSRASRRSPDLDIHPLNLPKEEREVASKRFSAMSMMSDPMEVDSDVQNGTPTSPQPQVSIPGSFDAPAPAPKTNGSAAQEEPPIPPPHKSNPTSPAAPAPPTPEEAEAFKAAGNKFYKAKEYKKAIEEYTKGMPLNNILLE
jgi:DnaJ family protein C protein 7